MRDALGALLAIIAAAAVVVSPFLDWYGDRAGRDYRLVDLFTSEGVTPEEASLLTGLFVAMLVAAVLLLASAVLRRWAWPMALGGLIALGVTILWMVRQYQVADSLTIGRYGLGEGVGCALVGGVVGLVAAAAAYGRGRGRHRRGAAATGRARRRRERREAREARDWDREQGDAPGAREGREGREGEVVEGPWPRDRREEPPDERRDAA